MALELNHWKGQMRTRMGAVQSSVAHSEYVGNTSVDPTIRGRYIVTLLELHNCISGGSLPPMLEFSAGLRTAAANPQAKPVALPLAQLCPSGSRSRSSRQLPLSHCWRILRHLASPPWAGGVTRDVRIMYILADLGIANSCTRTPMENRSSRLYLVRLRPTML